MESNKDIIDLNFLTQLKTNPDIFYRSLINLTNQDLRNLCKLSKFFNKLCKEDIFWENLWRRRVDNEELPTENIKIHYEIENLYNSIVEDLYREREIYFSPLTTRNQIKYFLGKTNYYGNELSQIVDIAVKRRNFDLLLWFLSENSIAIPFIVKYMINGDIPVPIVEKFIRHLKEIPSNGWVEFFVHSVPLNNIIQLPREKEKCNKDLVDIYFAKALRSKISHAKSEPEIEMIKIGNEINYAINAAAKNCPELIEIIKFNIDKYPELKEWINLNHHIYF